VSSSGSFAVTCAIGFCDRGGGIKKRIELCPCEYIHTHMNVHRDQGKGKKGKKGKESPILLDTDVCSNQMGVNLQRKKTKLIESN
jgi:hypothetical protein